MSSQCIWPNQLLLHKVPRLGDAIFPGRRAGSLLSDMSLTAVLR
jgi:hypothetical protein